jgi:YD repeat-containing protein
MSLNVTKIVGFLLTAVMASSCLTTGDIGWERCKITAYIAPYGVETFAYGNSKLISITDDLGGVTTFTYDQQGRVIARIFSNTSTTFTYTFSYDANDRVISVNGQFPTVYDYNSSGQLFKQSNSDGSYCIFKYPNTATKNFSSIIYYDTSGNILSTKTYQYDTKQNPFYVLLYHYYDGQTDDLQRPNNVTQMTQTFPGRTVSLNYSYTYDRHGNPTTVDYGFGKVNIEYANCIF